MYPVQRRTWLELAELQQAQLKSLLFAADPDWVVISTYLLQADIFVMINEQDQIIAQLCLIQNADQAEIKNIAVDPSQQGQGLAKALILYVVGALQQSSIHTLWIKTGNSSLDQLALYQKCGFRMSHIERNVFQNYPELIFENGIRCLDQVVLSIEYDLQTN
ncbi:GNAT family N-acetyltransferase [Acinetobacter haemolyticus]|uniref:GNAT family N-acetyltransferase n=1 Tax=Acinetobacter haemolyticus TaxID=29430 RepID=UPI000DE94DA1|nr:GNAT family N-acetyltransferase [Acinetobacter haemolyticus]WHR59264.1 GNAT family N-acetyltransferase [Acinetobacter haemolyticus]